VGDGIDNPRQRIEGRLGYRLYDCVWNRAAKDYDAECELEDLFEIAQELQQFAEQVKRELEARSTVKHRRSMDSVRYLDESEGDLQSVLLAESFHIDSDGQAALLALSEYAALKANEDPRVSEFRARALGMEYMSTEQANHLLYSHAARFLTWDQMRNLDVPLSEHKAVLLEPYKEVDRGGYFDHRAALRVEPPGISLMLRYTNLIDH